MNFREENRVWNFSFLSTSFSWRFSLSVYFFHLPFCLSEKKQRNGNEEQSWVEYRRKASKDKKAR